MSWPEDTATPSPKKRLDPTARTILFVWTVFVVASAALLAFSARDLDGWEGLIVAIYIIFAVIALVAVGVSTLVIRGMITTRTSQIVASVLMPPALTMLVVFVLMALG